MKRFYRRLAAVFAIALFILGVYALLVWKENKGYEGRGQVLIDKIEAFKRNTGRLPDSASELGVRDEMDNGPFYKRTDSNSYLFFLA